MWIDGVQEKWSHAYRKHTHRCKVWGRAFVRSPENYLITEEQRTLVPRYRPTLASVHETARAVVAAMDVLGMQLKKAA
jgi:hypothetical protein